MQLVQKDRFSRITFGPQDKYYTIVKISDKQIFDEIKVHVRSKDLQCISYI